MRTDLKTVRVSHYGETPTHYALLVDPTMQDGKIVGFSRKVWVAKSGVSLSRVELPGKFPEYYLTATVDLLDKNEIDYEAN